MRALLEQRLDHFDRWDIWLALILAIAVTVVSAWRIEATHAATLVNNCIFGTDSVTFWRWLLEGNYLGLGVHKHTLSVILTAVIAHPLVWLGLPNLTAVVWGMAVIWGCVAAVAYVYFRQAKLPKRTALPFTVLAMAAFGIATHSGIAETYGATVLMIGMAILLLPAAARLARPHTIASAILAGVIGAGLALANAPSIAFMLVYFVCLDIPADRADAAKRLAICIAIPFALISVAVIAPAIAAEGAQGTTWHRDYLGRYSSFENFTNAATLLNFLTNVVVYSFVAPLEYLQCRYIAADLAVMLSRPLALAAYLLTISLLITGLVRALRGIRRKEVLGMLGAVASILVFYLYFNPDEVLLYSPQWLTAVFFAAAPDFRRAALWAGVAAVLCLSVNIAPLHHPRTSDPQACCPNPPGSMLPREYPSALEEFRTRTQEAR